MSQERFSQRTQRTGLPGSGKSHRAAALLRERTVEGVPGALFSTDDFFIDPKSRAYVYDPKRIREAHAWNQRRSFEAMAAQVTPIIIDNTGVCAWESKPYVVEALKWGYEVCIEEPQTPWWLGKDLAECSLRNSHSVRRETLERMWAKWEPDLTVERILSSQEPPPPRRTHSRSHSKRQWGPSSG